MTIRYPAPPQGKATPSSLPYLLESGSRSAEYSANVLKIARVDDIKTLAPSGKNPAVVVDCTPIGRVMLSTGGLVKHQQLHEVPVAQQTGKAGGIYVPVSRGDYVLLLFADRDFNDWFSQGAGGDQGSPTTSVREYDNCIAIPFMNNQREGAISADLINNLATYVSYSNYATGGRTILKVGDRVSIKQKNAAGVQTISWWTTWETEMKQMQQAVASLQDAFSALSPVLSALGAEITIPTAAGAANVAAPLVNAANNASSAALSLAEAATMQLELLFD